ncbi:MAG: 2-carboxy-1,4-naphthoquinone phytyltransferase [Cyanobacteria bacterium P01_A01_bin.135]
MSSKQAIGHPTDQSTKPTRALWLAAIKPPMYSVAVIPIWVGSAIAWGKMGQLDWPIFYSFLLAAIAIIAWLNISNDVFDADTGIDRNKPHSVVNLTGNKPLMFWIANGALALGLMGILIIVWSQQDFTVLLLIILCCALGYSYQGPPFRLGYQGLGEPICFITFGPLAVAAAYYSQTQAWNWSTLAASVMVGISTSLILFCSHFHQVEDDAAAGKRSPIVRLGTQRGAQIIPWLCASLYAVTLTGIAFQTLPLGSLGVLLSAPIAYRLSRYMQRYHDQPVEVSRSKFIAVALHFWSGLLLGAGCLLPLP